MMKRGCSLNRFWNGRRCGVYGRHGRSSGICYFGYYLRVLPGVLRRRLGGFSIRGVLGTTRKSWPCGYLHNDSMSLELLLVLEMYLIDESLNFRSILGFSSRRHCDGSVPGKCSIAQENSFSSGVEL
ncbi:hypothetical protein AVEN_150287-1 [Araneus ventricosus]|uniref:Uncharacterized protein n=1 Tax=Araneus ventricosus TaxID=182803 RepID=A0A4Y2TFR4_ARAVE|nr:hypothetical protein AVEN_113569-1 [Araneus ventricosus]GBN97945.1 hypothetical protein AVEN_173060-1 [Araneus ventricosus]GBN97973.1 hypothetical protein AVEN_180343-1 [Araneus ventricosus]GBN98004.1 hypothetical protein AVEN_150287-1 [Araneus ventricosus]